MSEMENRDQAWSVLQQYVKSDVLLKHCVAVEVAMRAYANYFDESPAYWGSVGLLHDVDFELYPEDHPNHAQPILSKHGYDQDFIRHVRSHARDWPEERSTLEKTLLAVDELTGFVIACALVRPDKSLDNLQVKSVMKKFKDKAFARAVNRDTIQESAQDLGVDLKEHVAQVIQALAQASHETAYAPFLAAQS